MTAQPAGRATRIFVARLAGLAVFGPDGERIGKVRDVLATMRVDILPPRVLGLVVEISPRRRIFVPMLRVADISPAAVTLAHGTVNLTGFAQRLGETLVLGQIVGTPVRLRAPATAGGPTETGEELVVVDAAIEQVRSRDWVVGTVAVRSRRQRFGRRSPVRVVAWEEVSGLTLADRHGTDGLLTVFASMRPADVAAALSTIPLARQHEIVDNLDDERLADIFEEMSESDQKVLLAHLDDNRAADVLEAMSPDDAADLLAEMPGAEAGRLLELMEPDESEPVRRLLTYSARTAGGLMTPEPIVLLPTTTVAEALARIRIPDLPPALASMVFVCRPPTATPTGRYLGCVHAQRLLREAPFELVAGLVDAELPRLEPDAPIPVITRYFATYNLVAGPVVDDEEHLLGAVTVDDLLDHLLPEDWRDRPNRDGLALAHGERNGAQDFTAELRETELRDETALREEAGMRDDVGLRDEAGFPDDAELTETGDGAVPLDRAVEERSRREPDRRDPDRRDDGEPRDA